MTNAPTKFEQSAEAVRQAGKRLEEGDELSSGELLEQAADHTIQAAHRLADLETIVRARAGVLAKLSDRLEAVEQAVHELQALLRQQRT